MRLETSAPIFATLIGRLLAAHRSPGSVRVTVDAVGPIVRLVAGDELGTVMVEQQFAAVVHTPGRATIDLARATALAHLPQEAETVFLTTQRHQALFVETDSGFSCSVPCLDAIVTAPPLPKRGSSAPRPAPLGWWQAASRAATAAPRSGRPEDLAERIELTVTANTLALAVTDGTTGARSSTTTTATDSSGLAVIAHRALDLVVALSTATSTLLLTSAWVIVTGDESVTVFAKRLETDGDAHAICDALLYPAFSRPSEVHWSLDRTRFAQALHRVALATTGAMSAVQCTVMATTCTIQCTTPDGMTVAETLPALGVQNLPETGLRFRAPLLGWQRATEAIDAAALTCVASMTQQTPRHLRMTAETTAGSVCTALPLSAPLVS